MTTLQASTLPSATGIAEGLGRVRTALVGATYWLGLAAGWLRARVVTAEPGAPLRAAWTGATYWPGLTAGWLRARVVTQRPAPAARDGATPVAGSGLSARLTRLPGRPSRPRTTRIGRRVARAGAWLVIVAGVGTFAASIAVPAWFGLHDQRLLIVTSGSMSPFVDAGDAVVLQAIDDASQLRVGQVATFWPPGGANLVTHRIVDLRMYAAMEPDPTTGAMVPQRDASGSVIERPFILTKGDANATNDPDATPLSRVRGVVVGAHTGWGYVLNWANSAAGRMIMLVPPLVLLAALEITDSLAERRRRPKARPAALPQEDRFDAYLLT